MNQRIFNSKKMTVVLAATVCCLTVAYSQDKQSDNARDYARHRMMTYIGTGYANSIYSKTDNTFMNANYSLGSAIELKYAYFFVPKWGVSLGAGLSHFAAKGTLNMDGVIPQYNDPDFDASGQRYYDLHYQISNLTEQQRIWALEIPVQFHFEHRLNRRTALFAGLGARGYFPVISAQSKFTQGDGTLTVSGYEAFTDTWYTDPPHFGVQEVRTTPTTVKLQYSIDVIADFGGLFRLSGACDLYAGVYGSYGLMDVLPKTADRKDFITPEHNSLFTVNPLLSSNFLGEYNRYIRDNNLSWKQSGEQWHRWQAGVKIGIHFKVK